LPDVRASATLRLADSTILPNVAREIPISLAPCYW
jgi:hypothetical protein